MDTANYFNTFAFSTSPWEGEGGGYTRASTYLLYLQQDVTGIETTCKENIRPALSQFQSLKIRRSANFVWYRNVLRRISKL